MALHTMAPTFECTMPQVMAPHIMDGMGSFFTKGLGPGLWNDAIICGTMFLYYGATGCGTVSLQHDAIGHFFLEGLDPSSGHGAIICGAMLVYYDTTSYSTLPF